MSEEINNEEENKELDYGVSPSPSQGTVLEGSASLEVSFKDLLNTLVKGYGKEGTEEGKKLFNEALSKKLKQDLEKHKCSIKYNVLILFDNTTLIKSDADRIYNSIKNIPEKKPLLLVLLSKGGEPGSGYLIGKLCRDSANGKFIVTVPRYAKSAATLLATAADEIHMGSLSELGPIDPQINRMPTLGLKSSVEHIAELAHKMPKSADMFAKYLWYAVEPIQIGYYERVAESLMQYAEKLLENHSSNLAHIPHEIAHRLVYGYKDHGFVIDKSEALDIFGPNTIKLNSEEYDLSNSIYDTLSDVERISELLGYDFFFIGSPESKPELIKSSRDNRKLNY